MSEPGSKSIPAGGQLLTAAAAPAGVAGPTGRTILQALEIEKSFGVTRALSSGTLELQAGEVHVLVGENGSGKSTMVKILSGVHRPDGGTLIVGEDERPDLRSPRDAMQVGIATVFQEILVTPQRSVLDNVWLGFDGLLKHRISGEERRERARAMLAQLIDVGDLDAPVEPRGLNDRQAICIARALLRRPRVLILDEATSALDMTTRDNLFELIAKLCAQGVAVLFISHRMDEVERIGDRVTVMRSGATVATLVRGQFDSRGLVELMVGSERPAVATSETVTPRAQVGEPTLRVSGMQLRPQAAQVDAEFRAGEIIGVAGLEGHGQHEFLEVLAGTRPLAGHVTRLDGGLERRLSSRAQAFRSGIAYVPRDRRDEALFPTLSVLENFGLASMGQDTRRGLIRRRATASRFERFQKRMNIVARRPRDRITTLSGGNQQKVIISRWLARSPQVLVLNDPTRGVDLGAKNDIYRVLAEATAQGVTVIMLSTELIELIELMDRVLVFREGAVFCELPRERLTRSRLVAGYFGRTEE